ncbi:hypothetical protein LXA43DRAFT_512133 [Ganoderma leucocontextum]|nr:hypothetical protein LXA43DRAFT_512133 [Ganoderma leucocontextum]
MVDWSNVWGFISGALGLVPLVLALVYHQLPSTIFRDLDGTLQETESLLSSSLDRGLIPDSKSALQFMQYAEQLRDRAECVRPEVYRAKTYWQQLKGMVSGLTRKISVLSNDILDLRAEISTTSSRERKRLREEVELATSQGDAVMDDASPSIPLEGFGTAASRFYNLDPARLSGFLGSEVTLVDFPAGSVRPRLSGSAETAYACCCRRHGGHAYTSYAPPSKPEPVRRSHSTPSPQFERGDAFYFYDRVKRPTMHPGPTRSPDIPSPSDMPYRDVGASGDVVVGIQVHRRSR